MQTQWQTCLCCKEQFLTEHLDQILWNSLLKEHQCPDGKEEGGNQVNYDDSIVYNTFHIGKCEIYTSFTRIAYESKFAKFYTLNRKRFRQLAAAIVNDVI